ncbi:MULTISPECIES: hypothetical protein [Thiorhodovibrio]|uniref:hypothetical protein n=1 Tax=Thiorhodovibrio TaxID=61593 RepID=UPI0019147717|nr:MULTISPECIES: hypothetical protein [Thiorhodovibrio]WPL13397.1 hypothetical protein Thiosp_03198 [Thiorhodovibrio litoralis]
MPNIHVPDNGRLNLEVMTRVSDMGTQIFDGDGTPGIPRLPLHFTFAGADAPSPGADEPMLVGSLRPRERLEHRKASDRDVLARLARLLQTT